MIFIFLWRARLVIDECSSEEITAVVYPGVLDHHYYPASDGDG